MKSTVSFYLLFIISVEFVIETFAAIQLLLKCYPHHMVSNLQGSVHCSFFPNRSQTAPKSSYTQPFKKAIQLLYNSVSIETLNEPNPLKATIKSNYFTQTISSETITPIQPHYSTPNISLHLT